MIQAKVLTGGLQAQAVNPYDENPFVNGTVKAIKREDFEANNPPHPLVTPLPDRVGEVLDFEEVWQAQMDGKKEWQEIDDESAEHFNKHPNIVSCINKTRLAFKLIEVETENVDLANKVDDYKCADNVDVTGLKTPSNKAIESVEEASLNYAIETTKNVRGEKTREATILSSKHDFLMGANWQKSHHNKEVIATIEAEIKQLQEWADIETGQDKFIPLAKIETLTTLLETLNKK